MIILVKKILYTPLWTLRLLKIAKKSRKNRKDPEALGPQWRNDFIAKYAYKYLKMYNVDVEVIGYENIPKAPALLTPNHQSDADGFAMMVALRKQTAEKDVKNKISTFLAKIELDKKWKAKHSLRLINSFFIDRDNIRSSVQTLDAFGKYIKEKKTYGIVFPEGTRSLDGNLGEFKGGAFKTAKKEFLPIVPVTINNSFGTKDVKRKGRAKVQIIFHQAIKPMSILGQTNEAIANRVKSIVESKFINPNKK